MSPSSNRDPRNNLDNSNSNFATVSIKNTPARSRKGIGQPQGSCHFALEKSVNSLSREALLKISFIPRCSRIRPPWRKISGMANSKGIKISERGSPPLQKENAPISRSAALFRDFFKIGGGKLVQKGKTLGRRNLRSKACSLNCAKRRGHSWGSAAAVGTQSD